MAQNSNHPQKSCVSANDMHVGNTSNGNKCSIEKKISSQSNSVFVAEDFAINSKKEKNECVLIEYGRSTSRISQEDVSLNFPVKKTTVQSGGVLQLEQEKTIVYAGMPIAPKSSDFPALCNEINRQRKFIIMPNSDKDNCQLTHKTTGWTMKKPSEKGIIETSDADSKRETFQCRVCEKIMTFTQTRWTHELKYHEFYYKETIKCSKCFKSFLTSRQLIIHMYKEHTEIDFKIETLALMCREDFQSWKAAIEEETNSEYTLEYCVERENYIMEIFICRRNGQFKRLGDKSLKIKESYKSRLFCPARMLVITRVTNDMVVNVEVTYMKTHIGHESEFPHNSSESSQVSEPNQVRVYGRVISSIDEYYKLQDKNVHGFNAANEQFKCSECLSVFPLKTEIIDHVAKIHSGICMKLTTIYFKKFEEFVEWELDVEKNMGSKYILDPLYKNTFNLYLKCQQSGTDESGVFCPASIHVSSVKGSKCKYAYVEYLFTHLGHNIKRVMNKIEKIGKFELYSTTVLDDHLAAEKISHDASIKKINDSEWDVLNDSKTYKIRVYLDSQHSCMKAKCFQCNICLHQFTCTCLNSIMMEHKTICKHIHIICIKQKRLDEENIENIGLISRITDNDPGVNIGNTDSASEKREDDKSSVFKDITVNQQSKNAFSNIEKLNAVKMDENDSGVKNSEPDYPYIHTGPEVNDFVNDLHVHDFVKDFDVNDSLNNFDVYDFVNEI